MPATIPAHHQTSNAPELRRTTPPARPRAPRRWLRALTATLLVTGAWGAGATPARAEQDLGWVEPYWSETAWHTSPAHPLVGEEFTLYLDPVEAGLPSGTTLIGTIAQEPGQVTSSTCEDPITVGTSVIECRLVVSSAGWLTVAALTPNGRDWRPASAWITDVWDQAPDPDCVLCTSRGWTVQPDPVIAGQDVTVTIDLEETSIGTGWTRLEATVDGDPGAVTANTCAADADITTRTMTCVLNVAQPGRLHLVAVASDGPDTYHYPVGEHFTSVVVTAGRSPAQATPRADNQATPRAGAQTAPRAGAASAPTTRQLMSTPNHRGPRRH